MKKIVFIILIFSCKDKENSLLNNQIKYIDSLANIMDTSVFKIKDSGIEDGIIENYAGYGYFYDKKQPQFLKYYYHGHDRIFKDSAFYYYKKALIKIAVKEETDQHKVINSHFFYFDKNDLLNKEPGTDDNSVNSLLILAQKHLAELSDIHKLKN